MRRMRILAVGTALTLGLSVAASTTAAPSALTFHGTFDTGLAFSTATPGSLVFGLPVTGDWNLNLNMTVAPDEGRPRAVFVVRFVPLDIQGFPNHGLDAIWSPGVIEWQPITGTVYSGLLDVGAVLPGVTGVLNDPADGIYAYWGRAALFDSTAVLVLDANAGTFFYGAVPGPDFRCPTEPINPWCFDSPQVLGTLGR